MISFAFGSQALSSPITEGWGSWKSLQSENFTVHFPAAKKSYALRAIKLFEKIHAELRPHYPKTQLEYRTHVALVFSSDISQGFATPLGINQIVLYMEAPSLGSFSRYENWLELLFRHEYAHILSLQVWRLTQNILFLQRLVLDLPPNLLSPNAFKEGLAVWEESKKGLGRQEDPLTRMLVRTAIWQEAYPSLAEILNTTHSWPYGAKDYLYGGRLMAEFARQKGDASLRSYWGTDYIAMSIDNRMRVFGTAAEEIYQAMRRRDFDEFSREIAGLEEQGITPYERLSFDGAAKSFLCYSEEERSLLYFARPKDQVGGIFRISTQKDQSSAAYKTKHLRRQISSKGIACAKGLAYYSSEALLYPAFGLRYELHDGQSSYVFSRLAPGRSISYPSLSPDKSHLYYIEKDQDSRSLKRLALGAKPAPEPSDFAKAKSLLTIPVDSSLLQYTALAPNEEYLATLLRQGMRGFASLVLCDLKAQPDFVCRTILEAKAILTQPSFSRDSAYLYFSSDVDGIYNLYSYELGTKVVRRLSRTKSGLFYPAAGKDGLFALAFFKDGYDIVYFADKDLLQEKVQLFDKTQKKLPIPHSPHNKQNTSPEPKKDEEENISLYNGLREWRPYYTGIIDMGKWGSGINFFLGSLEARDPLLWHIIGASLAVIDSQSEAEPDDPEEDETAFPWQFYYIYNRYKMGLSFSHISQSNLDTISQAYLTYISPGRYVSLQSLVGYRRQAIDRALLLSGPSAILLMGDTRFFPKSISPELGWTLIALANYYTLHDSFHAKELEYGETEGGIAFYLPSLFPHHVNYLSFYGYTYFGPDRNERYHSQGNLLRNQDPAVFQGSDFIVWTYEYRLPLLWYSKPIWDRYRYFSLRYISLALFYDYGVVRGEEEIQDERQYRQYASWAMGLRLSIGLDISYLRPARIFTTLLQK